MITARHFFAYLPTGEPDLAWMARLRIAFNGLGYRTTGQEQPHLLASLPFVPDTEPLEPNLQIVQMTPGAHAKTRSELAALSSQQSVKAYAFRTLRIFNLLNSSHDSVEIVSDPLSVLPYYMARVPNGMLVCSSPRHLLAACPGLSRQLDEQGVFEFLSCGTPLGQRTLHKQVHLASAGQVIRWNRATGIRIDRNGRITVPPADAALAANTAADQISAHIRDSFGQLPDPILLPLTGGFDSRLIACFAASLQRKPRMVTLGYGRHDEIRVAQAVAETFGGSTTKFPPPHPDVLDLVPVWLDCLQGLADAHTLFMANLLSYPEPEGTPIYHGFIGDTLSGALLNRIPIETATEPDQIARGAAAHFFGGISPQAGEALGLSASVENAIDDICAEMVPGLAPHQTFTLWNLENIQRRLVGHQLLYVGQRFMPAPVFYSRPLMEFWLSVPRMALDERTLLRHLFQRNFPQVATLPHSEQVPTHIPRSRPALRYLSGWMLRRLRLRVARKLNLDYEKLENHSYIWSLWHNTTAAQRKKELDRLGETASSLKSQLGWNPPLPADSLWPACTSIPRKQLLMLRRMYLLGEYANSLPKPVFTQNPPAAIIDAPEPSKI